VVDYLYAHKICLGGKPSRWKASKVVYLENHAEAKNFIYNCIFNEFKMLKDQWHTYFSNLKLWNNHYRHNSQITKYIPQVCEGPSEKMPGCSMQHQLQLSLVQQLAKAKSCHCFVSRNQRVQSPTEDQNTMALVKENHINQIFSLNSRTGNSGNRAVAGFRIYPFKTRVITFETVSVPAIEAVWRAARGKFRTFPNFSQANCRSLHTIITH
jgi:hypothetical protein